MVKPETDELELFLARELPKGPLAEYLSAELLTAYLKTYLETHYDGVELSLEAMGEWLETEQKAPAGTVQLIFEQLQKKGAKKNLFLRLPGQEPGSVVATLGAAAAGQELTGQTVVQIANRTAANQLVQDKQEKKLLIFLDGVRPLAQVAEKTQVPLNYILAFLKRNWAGGAFKIVSVAPTTADADWAAIQKMAAQADRLPQRPGGTGPAKPGQAVKDPAAKKKKMIAVVVGVLLLASMAFLGNFLIKMTGKQAEYFDLNPADYHAALPLTKAQKTNTEVFIGEMAAAEWNRLSREEKLERCATLYDLIQKQQLKQAFVRSQTGAYLAMVQSQEQITLMQ